MWTVTVRFYLPNSIRAQQRARATLVDSGNRFLTFEGYQKMLPYAAVFFAK
ncbi:hypothetical protein FRUB_04989 [Fimbriiglobus ruber]|uniref:Uncharacterized protein n=1 Tax=Fimbriiglobus ruber TaxID=1908690 RepID=A0A225DY92_9BACT|nr:hypothetical protein FRUB_04989 [Fimbriiglobus ruber]